MCGGKPRIDGHRIPVEDVAIWHERMAMGPDEIVSAYPTLTLADVHAALVYYFDDRERIDADIEAGEQFVEEMKAKSSPRLPLAASRRMALILASINRYEQRQRQQ
jgi:uncharacterized protein (DUF433 family)